ncbi:endonuclease/exonuclease/phosphatase family protein [Streptosporangium sp. NPDC087985]|uniref:endonuclease/exonuclease/phosphatase family protein n=1 Tax=Streptosporangium sp. NPDC087985 TaxID=3366196 RepID=UPI0038234F6E
MFHDVSPSEVAVLLRVASYNVRSMRDDAAALGRVITALHADVLCVQEAPRFLGWRHRRGRLAASGGLTVAAGRRPGGVAVLVGRDVRLLCGEGHLLKYFPGLERRALAIAVVEAGGQRVAVGSIHLDLDAAARSYHAGEALALLRAAAGRFDALPVLAGDINEHSHDPTWRFLAGQLADCYPVSPRGDGLTFPSRRPRERIDAIFAAAGLQVISCGGAGAGPADLAAATDHLPVVAELGLPTSDRRSIKGSGTRDRMCPVPFGA